MKICDLCGTVIEMSCSDCHAELCDQHNIASNHYPSCYFVKSGMIPSKLSNRKVSET